MIVCSWIEPVLIGDKVTGQTSCHSYECNNQKDKTCVLDELEVKTQSQAQFLKSRVRGSCTAAAEPSWIYFATGLTALIFFYFSILCQAVRVERFNLFFFELAQVVSIKSPIFIVFLESVVEELGRLPHFIVTYLQHKIFIIKYLLE